MKINIVGMVHLPTAYHFLGLGQASPGDEEVRQSIDRVSIVGPDRPDDSARHFGQMGVRGSVELISDLPQSVNSVGDDDVSNDQDEPAQVPGQ